jgi:hypothetical protein
MTFHGAYREGESVGYFAVGQSVRDEHHDLYFAVGQRQGLACLTKRRRTGAAASVRQGTCTHRASQRRPPFAFSSIRDRGMGGGIYSGNEIAHALEFL